MLVFYVNSEYCRSKYIYKIYGFEHPKQSEDPDLGHPKPELNVMISYLQGALSSPGSVIRLNKGSSRRHAKHVAIAYFNLPIVYKSI